MSRKMNERSWFAGVIERLYQEKLRSINRKQAGVIVGILLAAAVGILMVGHSADKQRECAALARQQMLALQEGKTIDELLFTFNELRAMFEERYEECLDAEP